jgi:hypothetical protein
MSGIKRLALKEAQKTGGKNANKKFGAELKAKAKKK